MKALINKLSLYNFSIAKVTVLFNGFVYLLLARILQDIRMKMFV